MVKRNGAVNALLSNISKKDSNNNRIYEKCDWAHIVNVKKNKIVVKNNWDVK